MPKDEDQLFQILVQIPKRLDWRTHVAAYDDLFASVTRNRPVTA